MATPETPRTSEARFPTTLWGRVVEAAGSDSPGARDALAGLFQAYWYPIYALIRRRGHDPDEAQDLAQAYFSRLLERGILGRADPGKGRFRAFLRADCVFFLADRRDAARALKRGGGDTLLSIDARDAEGRYLIEPAGPETPEALFDRAWALALLAWALEQIAPEQGGPARLRLFERLKVVLTEGPRAVPYASIADELGMTVAAVESAARRLRKRFAEAVRSEIAETLDDPSPESVEDEIRSLFEALGQ
jgi:RNA polymerase sigma factor (sigma-70 family)